MNEVTIKCFPIFIGIPALFISVYFLYFPMHLFPDSLLYFIFFNSPYLFQSISLVYVIREASSGQGGKTVFSLSE